MKLFRITPTTALFLSFFITSCVLVYVDFWGKFGLVLFSATVFLVLRIGRARIFSSKSDLFRKYLAYTVCAALAAGLYSMAAFDFFYGNFAEYAGKSDVVRLRIESCDYSLPYIAQYRAVVTDSDFIPNNTRLLLTTEQIGLDDGVILEGKVVYSALSDLSSEGFQAERYYLPKQILLTAEDESLAVTGEDKHFRLTGFFRNLNEKFTAAIVAHTKWEYGGTAAAVLLGNKKYLSDQTLRDFRRIGVSHLLVVSGTHFSVLLSCANYAMLRMRISRRKRASISIVFILFFMALTGFSSSVLRAGIMYLIAQLALLVNRKANNLHSLALAGAIIVFVHPFAAADCGLQLSFAAAYSCLLYNSLRRLFYCHHRKKQRASGKAYQKARKPGGVLRVLQNIFGIVALTCVVNLILLPLLWLYFGEFSLLSVLSNLVFIPLVTGLMYLAGIFLLQYPLGVLTYPLGQWINCYCAFMLGLAESMAKLEHIVVPINYQFTIFFLIPLTVMLVLFPFLAEKNLRRLAWPILSVLAAFFLAIGIAQAADRPNVYISYVTKAKNDGLVLKSEGKVLFCDISDGSYGFLYELINEMPNLHACEVETLVLTHYHSKHVQYLQRLCEREILRNLVLPEPINEKETGLYETLLETAELKDIEVTTVRIGETYCFGEFEIQLHERMYLSRSTHPVTAVSVTAYDNTTTILSCSFNQSYEEITEIAEESEFVIFGHHSPVYKKAFGLSFDKEPKAVLLSNAAMEFCTEEFTAALSSMNTIHEPEDWCIKIDPDGNYTTEKE